MNNWKLKKIDLIQVNQILKYLDNKFNDTSNPESFKKILSSIFYRRGITEGKDLMYYLEKDLRFQHSPFLMNAMEDGIERILQAKDENEKVLIFGDSDVDGITSTAILYSYLKKIGLNVEYQLPMEDDGYGLSIKAVEDFAEKQGTLIITVDCGISNFEEIDRANELGIDVIVTDHHNPPETLPEAIIIIDPKLEDSGYPFTGISGAAVAYKLVSALRFAQTDFYNQEICILDIIENKTENFFELNCIKIRNLVITKELHEKIIPGKTSIYDLKFPYFVQRNVIFAWDSSATTSLLNDIFGSGIEFNITDLRNQVSSLFPVMRSKTASELQNLSSIGKYIPEEQSTIRSLYNLYVSFTKKLICQKYPSAAKDEDEDIQLVALAALADIMPMKDENRLFVNNGLDSIKKSIRPGLRELISELRINPDNITSTDLSWSVIPSLNATGRLGQPDIALKLLLSEVPAERAKYAVDIVNLNEQRKDIVNQTIFRIQDKAKESMAFYQNKICIVVDEEIHPGLTGLFASRLMSDFKVPAIAIAVQNDICTGSIRTNRGFVATTFLDSFGDIFINHGGHNCAAGFSFQKQNLELFLSKIQQAIPAIQLEDEKPDYNIDVNIPVSHLTPDLFRLIDIFEPYGAENNELILKTEQLLVYDAVKVGKKDPMHLKLNVASGDYKFPAMYWNQGDLLNNEIKKNEKCDILYSLSKNYFNGMVTNQLIIKDLRK